jgi:hypothetical protein
MSGFGGERSGPFLSQEPNEPPLAFFIGGIMARYNINVRTSSHIADTKPVEMDSLDALRVEMALFVGELLKNHADLIWKDQDWQVDVTDASGLILYILHLSAADTAATAGTLPTR